MGFDPLTIGIGLSAASSLYGAFSQNKAANRAQDQAQQNFQAQQQGRQDLQSLILPYLNGTGSNIDDLVYGTDRRMPGGAAGATPLDAGGGGIQGLFRRGFQPSRGGSDFNTGQDGLMQLLRTPDPSGALTRAASGNTQFDTSKLFDSIRATSNQDLGDQLAASRASAGSIGQRFGTAQLRNEALLRSRAVVGQNATYAQAGQSAFEAAQNRALTAGNALMGGQQGYAQLIGQLLGQKNANTSSLLGVLAGQPVPQQQIIPQTNGYPEAVGDIGNLALLYPFLRQLGSGGGAGAGAVAPNVGPYYVPGG